MKRRIFSKNSLAVAMMYDAVLFIVMVSMSGVVLLPALQSDIAIESSIDKHREHIADEALNTLLVSRVDKFSYKVGGEIIDGVAASAGIDPNQPGIYTSVTEWILGRDQLHKTYANLIAENMGCQFKLPFSVLGSNRLNLFTDQYDVNLKENIKEFLDNYLGDKYQYNLTAVWHPIRNIGFGGDIYIGPPTPDQDLHVATSNVMMPYRPELEINGEKYVFTRYWVENNILKKNPVVSNFIDIVDAHRNGIPPYDDINYATNVLKENITEILHDFILHGMKNDTGDVIFPGVMTIVFDYGFSRIKDAIMSFADSAINATLGEAFRTVDDLFGALKGVENPVFNAFKDKLHEEVNKILNGVIGTVYGTLEEALDALEQLLIDTVENLVNTFIIPYVESLVDLIFDNINFIDGYEALCDWLFGLISINKAEVTLSIWEA